jgi:Vault protein inter-alpha-trypsin.
MVSSSSSVRSTFRRAHFPFAPLEVTSHQVNVKIDGQVAITSIDQEFYNPNDQRLEGFYMFPVPKGAHIDKFSMEIGGKSVDAELLPADKARGIYEDIVRKMRIRRCSSTPAAIFSRSASFRSNRAAASPLRFPIRNCFAPTPGRSLISTR